MKTLKIRLTGINQLLMNNPQTVDPFNRYTKLIAPLQKQRNKSDEILMKIRDLSCESKLYMNDTLGIYVPTDWIMASIAKNSHAQLKIAKAKIRSAIFVNENKAKLTYAGMEHVKTKEDIVKNPELTINRLHKISTKSIMKLIPAFNNWSFEFTLTFDTEILTRDEVLKLMHYNANYGGYGDLRPTYGRCNLTVI